MPKITDPAKLREIAERNARLGFGTIESQGGVDRYIRGPGGTGTADFNAPGTGFDIGPTPGGGAGAADLLDGPSKITDGTESIHESRREFASTFDNALSDLESLSDGFGTNLQEQFQNVQNLVNQTNQLNEADLSAIEQAGIAAGREFDPLIAQAQEAKRQGLAKATVGAGERGGFESTQFAGQAALTQTEGGTFVGAGGELSKIQGQLDQNISKLEIAKQNAISAARAAQQKSIRTGRVQDAQLANDLLTQAQNVFDTQQKAIQKRIDVIGKIEESRQAQFTFGQEQEDRTIEGLAPTLAQQIQDITDPAEVQNIIQQAAQEQGVDPNRLASAVNLAVQDFAAEAFFTGSNIISLMKETPAGEEKTITDPNTGTEFTILGTKNPDTVVATSDRGEVSVIDKSTGKTLSKTEPGVGKTKTRAGGITITQNQANLIGEKAQVLNESAGGDGFVNTAVYVAQREDFASKGGKVSVFDDVFQNKLNPDDPTALPFFTKSDIQKFEGEEEGFEITDESINSILGSL